jgi:hypothetical protein
MCNNTFFQRIFEFLLVALLIPHKLINSNLNETHERQYCSLLLHLFVRIAIKENVVNIRGTSLLIN